MKTKKVLIVLVIVIALLAAALYYFSAYGGGNNAAAPAAAPEATQPPAQTAAPSAPVETLAPEAELAPVSEQQVDENANAMAQAMLPVMDAGVRALRDSEAGHYDAEDAAFVWNVLYYLCAGNELQSDLIDYAQDGVAVIPAKLMQELASACFASYSELPALPEDMKNISYDKKLDAYEVQLSDGGDAQSRIMRVVPLADQGYTVFLAFVNEAAPEAPLLSTYAFDLGKNAQIDGIADPLFPMSVNGGMDASNVLSQVTGVTGEGEAMMLDIHHVQLYWKQDEADGEVYVPAIVADTQPDETLRLFSTDVVDWNTIYALITGGKEPDFADTEAAFAWFKENYATMIDYDPMVYQMRAYDGVIYEMVPLYQFYFAG
ncbi:MAG: hypothetical protein Q4E65_03055 [Clostridia bacterium]|nr:hypothetical protein [Clostridia bacterium]